MSESFGCFSLSGQVNSARPSVTRDIDQISVSVNLSVTRDYRIDRNGTVWLHLAATLRHGDGEGGGDRCSVTSDFVGLLRDSS